MRQFFLFAWIFGCGLTLLQAQTGGVRGSVIDQGTGQPLPFVTIVLEGSTYATLSEDDGFYTLANIPEGEYTLKVETTDYEPFSQVIKVSKGKMTNQNIGLRERAENIGTVEINAEREAQKNEVRISTIRVTQKDINRIPSAGGEADFAQYLQVVPGVVFTGDQGGQLYIRGGAPIQNRIMLDGMTIYSPFHSLGFFSVFETETIRTADVYTGGFSAKYGGRSSAIVDIRTREGNRKRFGGMVNINPFVSKILLEGPMIKLNEDGSNTTLSYLFTAKHSYLDRTSKSLYSYANDGNGLPFSFTDLFGKVSLLAENGSRVNLFGFSFNDRVNFAGTADYRWRSGGGGLDFRIVPGSSKILMDGNISYSGYRSDFVEGDSTKERTSAINSFAALFNFTYSLGTAKQLNYGLEISSFFNDFSFINNSGIPYQQDQSNTEASAYVRYSGRYGNLVIEPSLRGHFYASLGEFRFEPRLGLKYNITDYLRIKAAGGMYSQNLISSVDERDIVNLFIGFLGGPDDGVYRYDGQNYTRIASRLQTSVHAVGGVEINAGRFVLLNIEPYWKTFPQIIGLNRRPADARQATFVVETGQAYGIDLTASYDHKQLYLYLAYSLSYTDRNDGAQQYYAHFDRRHNLNAVASYEMAVVKPKEQTNEAGAVLNNRKKTKNPLELSMRWNLGSGFPFTLTQGFYQWQTFAGGINSDYLRNNNAPNTQLGVIYEPELNRGRLPYYHRLDLSAKYTFDLPSRMKLQLGFALTNAYNRDNIFYFDRIEYKRVDQLPILPSLNINFKW